MSKSSKLSGFSFLYTLCLTWVSTAKAPLPALDYLHKIKLSGQLSISKIQIKYRLAFC